MTHPDVRERPRTPAFLAYVPPGAAALTALSPRACHWPIGELGDEDFRFCGEASGHRSYCPAHRALALRRRR